jgi:medium-chain acyl-[acyl-carrier-protein] hydrolase
MQIFKTEAVMPQHGQRVTLREVFTALEHAATEHVDALGVGRGYLEGINSAWVLTSEHVLIKSMPLPGQRVTISTWPGSTKFALFPRYFLIEDEMGNELLRSASLWTIMDLTSRKIVYPGQTGLTVNGIVTGKEAPLAKTVPSVKEGSDLYRTVVSRDIDSNGHMNNTVYLDWFEDILPPDFYGSHGISELTVVYKKELRLGTQAQVRTKTDENGKIILQLLSDGAVAFSAMAQTEEKSGT